MIPDTKFFKMHFKTYVCFKKLAKTLLKVEHSRGSISADAVHEAYLAIARFPDKRFPHTKLGKKSTHLQCYGVKLPYLKAKNK